MKPGRADAIVAAQHGAARGIAHRPSGNGLEHVTAHGRGPARLVTTKGYGSSMALSTLTNLLATQQLRRGEGEYATPAARRKERLLTCGRTKSLRAGV